MKFFTKNCYLIFLFIIVGIFFAPFLINGKVPIPSDALVGMYYPYRDEMAKDYANGYPFKNPLITDPVRQQYPYRFLALNLIKQGIWPTWNPYVFAGTPLLANIQTAIFYPLNLIYLLFDFANGWSIQIFLQSILTAFFMFIYLKSLKITDAAAFLGSITWAFSGFMVAWLEWNTLCQAALWLPLILLSKDKLINKFSVLWIVILIFSEVSVILAGHLQTAMYLVIFSTSYLLVRILQKAKIDHSIIPKKIILFALIGLIVFLISAIQLFPTINFILASYREFDLSNWQRMDWFIPWQNLLQFIAPDFFGNPATGNYWGIWNYGEFIGYIGLVPFIFAVSALFYRRDKKVVFFGSLLFICLFLGLPTFIGKIPYQLNLPFISTLQPSRIMVLIDFCLAVLAALGIDYLLNEKKVMVINQILFISAIFILIFIVVWLLVLFPDILNFSSETVSGLQISKRNLLLPTGLLVVFNLLILSIKYFSHKKITKIALFIVLLITVLDLLRFSWKFTPFTPKNILYPESQTVNFLKENLGSSRFMTMDRSIMPPNVSIMYKLSSVDGYDPIYLKNYAQIAASWSRNLPDYKPASFNRILTPENIDNFWTDLMGVKYILSLNEESNAKLKLVDIQGKTRIYQNLNVYPRAFFVEEVVNIPTEQEILSRMYADPQILSKIAYTTKYINIKPLKLENTENTKIKSFTENTISIEAFSVHERLLIFSNVYFRDWKAYINNKETTIYPVDFNLMGVVVPTGKSVVEFKI